MTTRRQLMQGAAVSMLGLSHLPNFAQTRVENLRIIVGFPPGGTTDAFSRRIAEKMRGTYATNVIVDNKPGAGGQIGVTTLKAAAADGAHILYSPASMLTIYPHSYSRLSYAQSDVTPIGIGHSTDHAFVVGPAVPDSVKNIKDCSGNPLINNQQAKFVLPEKGQKGDILINEVLFNPCANNQALRTIQKILKAINALNPN
jgi:tripartite-type tricarboxylate transporter receptor subunit TctC